MHMALFLIILGGLITLGCNGDDELSSDTQVDKDTISYYGDLSITFQLQNMNGTAVTSFDEGENFMFRLVLQNTGKQSMDMPSIRELTQFDLFHVYTIDGKDMGLPWDYMGMIGNPLWIGYPFSLSPNQSLLFRCFWFDCDKAEPSDLGRDKPRAALPKGKYYTLFELNLGENRKAVIKKVFTIK
jgi:hypothetical protein